ncbi:MAG: ABC transporter permease [Alicyclobacillus sp.]|nr:ABC transporter permease [Alicyclobacillus sp.]
MAINYAERFQPPSWQHILGTDYAGRDIFIQLVYGSQQVLIVAVITAFFTIVIGTILGMAAGLIGGRLDHFLMVITNLFLTLPQFPVYIILGAIFSTSLQNYIAFGFVLSIFGWAGLARAVRSQVLSLKEREFIVICRVMGRRNRAIIFKELLPNITSFLAINFIFSMRGAMSASVGVMMLGLVPYNEQNWGNMLNQALSSAAGIFDPRAYLFILAPIVCLALVQLGTVFLANGLDEALNPRLRR